MAELILTEEEKEALSWLDLDDENLGKYVRYNVANIRKEYDIASEENALRAAILTVMLMEFPLKLKSTKFTMKSEGCYSKNQDGTFTQLGDWQLTLKKIK